MIHIKEAIIVEGKYDKEKLRRITDAPIICTHGFELYRSKSIISTIRRFSKTHGIIILTDSDRAGFLIRNFICGIVDNKYIKHAYIPQRPGKESRKPTPSKDGFLGVEGIDKETIIASIQNAATVSLSEKSEKITKSDLYNLGFCGRSESSILRNKLLKFLDLPVGITANPLLSILNSLYTPEEFGKILQDFEKSNFLE